MGASKWLLILNWRTITNVFKSGLVVLFLVFVSCDFEVHCSCSILKPVRMIRPQSCTGLIYYNSPTGMCLYAVIACIMWQLADDDICWVTQRWQRSWRIIWSRWWRRSAAVNCLTSDCISTLSWPRCSCWLAPARWNSLCRSSTCPQYTVVFYCTCIIWYPPSMPAL